MHTFWYGIRLFKDVMLDNILEYLQQCPTSWAFEEWDLEWQCTISLWHGWLTTIWYLKYQTVGCAQPDNTSEFPSALPSLWVTAKPTCPQFTIFCPDTKLTIASDRYVLYCAPAQMIFYTKLLSRKWILHSMPQIGKI